jgi:N-methylhydantoinase A/oxoprolinase/acetone carboxylase beta subunit
VPEWAAGFSAFGCACADFEYRFDQQVDVPFMPHMGPEEKVGIGQMITGAWRVLEARTQAEFDKSGYGPDRVRFTRAVRMSYYGQLIDIEVESPHEAIDSPERVADLIAAFESTYKSLYARSASSPELGYLVAQALVKGTVDIEKPTLPSATLADGSPEVKATRPVWWSDGFVDTPVIDMAEVQAGQTIHGPAILEAESTTLAIPPDREARLDAHRIFHLTTQEER